MVHYKERSSHRELYKTGVCTNVAPLQCQKRALKNNYEGVHFSKVESLLPTTLLNINCFTDIFQLFSNIYTKTHFAELVSLATPESISYGSIRNLYCVTFLVFIIDICLFPTIAVFSLNKFSIKEEEKQIQDFLFYKRTSDY